MSIKATRSILLASVLGMTLALSACGSDEPTETSSGSSDTAATDEATTPEEDAMVEPFGAGCAGIPADGEGSSAGMADDPVATAASNNPVLSTLVAAVTAAGLGDTLNGAPELTVFAPANSAFEAIDTAALESLLLPENVATLTSILTFHVIGERIAPEDLAGRSPRSTALRSPSTAVARCSPPTSAEPPKALWSAATCRPQTRPCTSSTPS